MPREERSGILVLGRCRETLSDAHDGILLPSREEDAVDAVVARALALGIE